MAAAVVVEKFERRIAVGAKKDRRRPRMSDSIVRIVTNFVVVGGGAASQQAARAAARVGDRS